MLDGSAHNPIKPVDVQNVDDPCTEQEPSSVAESEHAGVVKIQNYKKIIWRK